MALFVLVLALSLATSVQPAPLFGTENGYDAGGTDPICFTSKTNGTAPIAGGLLTGGLEVLNYELFQGQDTEFELLPRCFNGTDLDVQPLDLGTDRVLETGSNYTFRVTLEVLLSQISDKIPQLSNSTIYVRFLLCNTIILGFCNPLQDTRELDKNLVPSETDFDADETDSFEDGGDRWRYEQGKTLLGISYGPYVLSRWVKWTLDQVETDSQLYNTSVDITLQLPNGILEGAYSFIGHAVMNFEIGNGIIERVDIADAIPDIILEVRNPPTIGYVSDTMKIVIGVATGIFGSFALFCLGFIIYYRANPVMQLAQAPFLAALAGCCLVSIGFTFTFLPSQDVFCRLRGPMILIPLTTAAAIMVARTWRIYVTLTVALRLGRQGKKGKSLTGTDLGERLVMLLTFLSQLPFLLCQRTTRSRSSVVPSLRQAVTAQQTASLVAILSFPQVFLQIFAALYYDRELELEFDADMNIGRYVCTDSADWNLLAGFCVAASVFLLAVAVSWISSNLPSAFNEKDQVFLASAISAIFASLVAALEAITDDVTTSPDVQVSMMTFTLFLFENSLTNKCSLFIVQVYLRSSCSIGVSVSVLVIIVWPKIRRVRSGEKVVISGLLGATRFSTPSSTPSNTAAGELESPRAGQNAIAQNRNRVSVNRGDPMPKELETGILAMGELLRSVTNEWYVFFGGVAYSLFNTNSEISSHMLII
jgi:hypothetical protein